MDPTGYHVKLIELAYQMASAKATSEADLLRRFRTIYRHMAATVDGAMAEMGFGPYGPMMSGMPGMRSPDASKALSATDTEIGNL